MFELPISVKTADRNKVTVPDETSLIQDFLNAHDFYEESTRVSKFTLNWFWVRDNLKVDQVPRTQPLLIAKRWNSYYSNSDYTEPPLFLMGAFFSGVRGDQVDLERNESVTFSKLKQAIGQQSDSLEGGFNPIRATHKWMRSPLSGYFVTGRTISTMMSQEQRNMLFGTPPKL